MNQRFYTLISIFVGGVLGTFVRYIINLQTMSLLFPLGTVVENIVGSFLLGVLTGWALVAFISPVIKEGIGVGFCGGFTTMSTLAADMTFLVNAGNMFIAGIYLLISLFGGIAFALFGIIIGRKWADSKREVVDRG